MKYHQPLVTEIKGHSLDDGEGIRSVVFFKGCPLSCVWCHNPEAISPDAVLSYDAGECMQLGDCAAVCDQQAIQPATEAFINRDACALCGKCVDACASEALSMVGQARSVESVVDEIKRYKSFFDSSGGGVTLSGGEATLYLDYCEALAQEFKQLDIHVLLETSGFFNKERFLEKLYPHLDEIYFDIKLIDSEQHKKFCGQKNDTILANFVELQKRSLQGGVSILPRVPLIPGVTTSPQNLSAIAEFLKECGASQVSLLSYNPLWVSKAEKIGRVGEYNHDQWLAESDLEACRKHFEGLSIVS